MVWPLHPYSFFPSHHSCICAVYSTTLG
uniref:Uncharacterized protein n=1 Tax=Arundo donax TaxID=35708 RepID=A0A0A9CJL6_ARUDO